MIFVSPHNSFGMSSDTLNKSFEKLYNITREQKKNLVFGYKRKVFCWYLALVLRTISTSLSA
jgi:hypothetical protein